MIVAQPISVPTYEMILDDDVPEHEEEEEYVGPDELSADDPPEPDEHISD